MPADSSTRGTEMTMDAAALYREEMVTDRKLGLLRVMIPIRADGSADPARVTIYTGEAQLMTNVGPLPISFDIPAADLTEAVAHYADAAKVGVERAMRELQEMRRQASSSIVIPPSGAMPPIGGLGGGGKIQMP
ncbi:MAG: hypothetical protein ABI886_00815 [Betaproteobacteria bacterium]